MIARPPRPAGSYGSGQGNPESSGQSESVSEFTIEINGPANMNSTISTISGRY